MSTENQMVLTPFGSYDKNKRDKLESSLKEIRKRIMQNTKKNKRGGTVSIDAGELEKLNAAAKAELDRLFG